MSSKVECTACELGNTSGVGKRPVSSIHVNVQYYNAYPERQNRDDLNYIGYDDAI